MGNQVVKDCLIGFIENDVVLQFVDNDIIDGFEDMTTRQIQLLLLLNLHF